GTCVPPLSARLQTKTLEATAKRAVLRLQDVRHPVKKIFATARLSELPKCADGERGRDGYADGDDRLFAHDPARCVIGVFGLLLSGGIGLLAFGSDDAGGILGLRLDV